MKKVAIVIPYFRAPDALNKTLSSIRAQTNIEIDIFIRDNSLDNVLYTRAVNEGLRKYCYNDDYEYSLVLNHDVIFEENSIRALVDCMVADKSIGICAPLSLDRNGRINWAGSLNAWPWGSGIVDEIKNIPTKFYETYWINGACMLLRNRMVREIGLLDENMSFICSDSDYSFTARSRGFKVGVEPSAKICHELSGSTNRDINNPISLIKWYDMVYFCQKWISGDLFRHYAFEGKEITPQFIEYNLKKAMKNIEKISNFFRNTPPTEQFNLHKD